MKAERKYEAKRKATKRGGTIDLERVYQKLRRQPAQLSDEQVDAIEKDFAPGAGGSQYRRAGLAMLTRSGKQLIEWAEGDRESGEALADAAVGIQQLSKRMRAVAKMLESSSVRGMTALCVRDDAINLLDEARKHHLSDVRVR
jgi:hypothetical protein